MATIAIPLVTLPVGTQNFGPAAIADADSLISITIDRTVAGGLNSLTPASTLLLRPEQSNDGGTTWRELGNSTVAGGLIPMPANKGGGNRTTDVINTQVFPGTGRQVRAAVIVAGTSVAVQGSLTTS